MNQTYFATVFASVALAASTPAQPVVYELTGQITNAENLTFAVINGNLLSQNPQQGDLPLAFNGELVVDTASGLATFAASGSFTSPTRSYTFDVVSPNVIAGLDVLSFDGPVIFGDAFDSFDFDLALSAATGRGEFSLRLPDVVPSSPTQDVFIEGFISSVNVVPSPASAGLLASAGVIALGRKRLTNP